MKRDRWFSLWWCVPGLIIIATALMSFDHTKRYWGLVADQWAGLLVAGTLLGLAIGHARQVTGKDGRPEGMIRESKRTYGMSAQGYLVRFGPDVASVVILCLGQELSRCIRTVLGGSVYSRGIHMFGGGAGCESMDIVGVRSSVSRLRPLPALADGNHQAKGILFGMMFIAVALSFSIIQVFQIRKIERQNESH